MALNQYYPQYQPNFYGVNPYAVPQNIPAGPGAVQRGGFIRVQNEGEARAYPVAPGNSVTFINENAPYCYTKTVDFSQLDRPKFERYRLVKEEDPEAVPADPGHAVASSGDLEELRARVDELTARVDRLTDRKAVKVREVADDD